MNIDHDSPNDADVCLTINNKIKNAQWIKSRNCDIMAICDKKDSSPSLRCMRCPKVEIFVENVLRKIEEPNTKPPSWRTSLFSNMAAGPGNCVKIWNLLWKSSRLIIWTKTKDIYTSTFSNTLTPKMAKYHEISVYFSTKVIFALSSRTSYNFEIQNALVCKRSLTLLSWKVVNRCKFSTSYAWGV